jgi:nucleoside-diphosphate-sugar epimerase
MRVTVTGATGTIGLACARMLVRAGHEVRGLVRNAGAFRSRCAEERIELVEGDILDRTAVAEALDGAEAAIHCVDFPPSQFPASWDATRHTLEALGSDGQFVMPGSVRVYGPAASERIGPDHPKDSPARLGEARADLEKAVTAQGGTVVHLPEVYGAGVTRGPLHRVFVRALAGRAVWYPGDLDRQVEFLYIDDAARALIAPLGRRQARGVDFTAPGFACTTPRSFTLSVFKAAGRSPRLWSIPQVWLRAADSLHRERRLLRDFAYLIERPALLDGTVIRQELGWAPETDYDDGIRRTLRWLRAQAR